MILKIFGDFWIVFQIVEVKLKSKTTFLCRQDMGKNAWLMEYKIVFGSEGVFSAPIRSKEENVQY